jgi:DNA replication protein DnaC
MAEVCTVCGGLGLQPFENSEGVRFMRDCVCRIQRRTERMLAGTRIPSRYEHCTLDNFESAFSGVTKSVAAAHLRAREFVERYPIETGGLGLLLTGSIGVGKTHLAAGILRKLVTERGATGLFCDYRELLKQVQNSYNPQVQATELAILEPIFRAEVLVLDELGAAKPSEWVWDTVGLILNTRYNNRLTTIITTNYANAGPLGSGLEIAPIRAALREETLGDRIGERMRSRIQEMCVRVEMQGKDFRQSVAMARFS